MQNDQLSVKNNFILIKNYSSYSKMFNMYNYFNFKSKKVIVSFKKLCPKSFKMTKKLAMH